LSKFRAFRAVGGAAIVLLAFGGVAASAYLNAQTQPEQAIATPSRFEVASVRLMQNRDKLPIEQQMFYMSQWGATQFTTRNATLETLLSLAFGIDTQYQLARKPAWFDSTFYEIAAKPEGDARLNYEQMKPLLQQLLIDRFHLAYHREIKDMKGYALVAAKGGAKLKTSSGGAAYAYIFTNRIDGKNNPLDTLASMLAHPLGQPVVNETGLKGNYDFRIDYASLQTADADSSLPSLFTAIEEQLGLKLENRMVPVDVFVIDHVDKVPTEN